LAASADDKVLHLKVFMAPLAAFSISIPLKTSMWRPAKTEKASTRAVPTRYPHPLKQKLKAGRSIGLTKPTSMGSCIVNPFHSLGSNRPAEDLQLRNDEKGDKSAATRTKQGTFRQRKFSATLHFKVPKGFPPRPGSHATPQSDNPQRSRLPANQESQASLLRGSTHGDGMGPESYQGSRIYEKVVFLSGRGHSYGFLMTLL
jgi:hypothetical protein